MHGYLNRIMEVLGVPTRDPTLSAALGAGCAAAAEKQRRDGAPCYGWEPSRDPAFFPGRQASVVLYEAVEEEEKAAGGGGGEKETQEKEKRSGGERGEGGSSGGGLD